MSLQFDVEEFIRPLVSGLYNSSEEDMEIDSASVVAEDQDADSDIEVIACYRETPIYPPQLAGGRAMTFEQNACGDEEALFPHGQAGSIDSTFDLSDNLVDWFVGSPPTGTHSANDPAHCMANCGRLEPIPYSLMSPPLIDQGPSADTGIDQWSQDLGREDSWTTNPHITGLAVSASGLCGQPN